MAKTIVFVARKQQCDELSKAFAEQGYVRLTFRLRIGYFSMLVTLVFLLSV
jgi:superfamily II DNA/RNA helicase